MSFSVDGIEYKGYSVIKYGWEFPKLYHNYQVELPKKGKCNIWITYVGTPEWRSDYSVEVKTKFYITEFLDGQDALKFKKVPKLHLVK